MKALRSLLIASLLAVATSASAQDPSPWKFEFHGFVTGSMFVQNQVFSGGTGQDNLLAAPAPSQAAPCKTAACTGGTFAAGRATKSGTFFGADARQSRWVFVLSGPSAFGAVPKVYFEGDFLGNTANIPTGGTAAVPNPLPTPPPASGTSNATVTLTYPGGAIENTQARLRQAYGELKWGPTQLQMGQYSAHYVLLGLSDSVAHIANPITFGTGTIGGRTVGLRVLHTMPVGDMSLQLAGEVAAPKWNDPVRGGALANISQAWASGMPAFGAKAALSGKGSGLTYAVSAAVQYESVDFKSFGTTTPTGVALADGSFKTSASPYAVAGYLNVGYSMVNLTGTYYTGQGTGVWTGAIGQLGQFDSSGFWAQLRVQPLKELSIAGLYGMGSANEKGVRLWNDAAVATGTQRKENTLMGGILRYSDGGYTFAAEYYQMETTWLQGTWAQYAAGTAPGTIKTDGYQFVLSGHYAF